MPLSRGTFFKQSITSFTTGKMIYPENVDLDDETMLQFFFRQIDLKTIDNATFLRTAGTVRNRGLPCLERVIGLPSHG